MRERVRNSYLLTYHGDGVGAKGNSGDIVTNGKNEPIDAAKYLCDITILKEVKFMVQKIYTDIPGREEERWEFLTCDLKIKPMYYISTYGRVKNMDEKILKPHKDKDGYLKFTLQSTKSKKIKRFSHRLVAMQFIPNPENKPEINHIRVIQTEDGPVCPDDDNYYKNLEWCTREENIAHSIRNKLQKRRTCGENKHSKFSDDEVGFICFLLERGKTTSEILKILGFTMDNPNREIFRGLIKHVRARRTWLDVSQFYNF